MSSFLVVKSVEGKRIPFSLSSANIRIVGYERQMSPEPQVNWFTKQEEPSFEFVRLTTPVMVPDPAPDGYFQKAIACGDLEYIETVDNFGTPSEKRFVDPRLLALTRKHFSAPPTLVESETPAPTTTPEPAQPAQEQ